MKDEKSKYERLSVKDYISSKFSALCRRSNEFFYKKLFIRGIYYKVSPKLRYVKAVLLASRLRSGGKAKVAFLASNRAMWKYNGLYEKLVNSKHFDVKIVLSPFILYDIAQQKRDIEELRKYFDERGISYEDFNTDLCYQRLGCGRFIVGSNCKLVKKEPIFSNEDGVYNLKKDFAPDIVFYQQPYSNILMPQHDSSQFYDKLLCYFPYALWTSTGEFSYNSDFHNLAWKLFYSTPFHLYEAKMCAKNEGRNVVVAGYPGYDELMEILHDSEDASSQPILQGANENEKSAKKTSTEKKPMLIWAPHFTIIPERSEIVRSNFLWMAELMLSLAEKYKNRLDIVFKPHPRLFSELCVHPDWGRVRAEKYYEQWKNMPNTSLHTGGYASLFIRSQAMIHDCGSFSAEYHYTGNPVMFVTKDPSEIIKNQSVFGNKVLSLHYFGSDASQIEAFIEETVLAGKDPMKQLRENFRREYLCPPNGKTAAENAYENICASLCIYD